MKRKVMVVDDDNSLLDAIEIMITQLGHYVVITNTSLAVPELINNYKPEVILIDVNLGNANGREVCRHLKDNPLMSGACIFLFSADGEKLKDYQECNADGILTKPFTKKQLNDLINSCNPGDLDRHHLKSL